MIYELRNYTLHPGQRDTLIDLFEREFIEGQEEAGIGVVGHFRDLDEPNMYPWMRKFPDMEARRAALTAFYGGPIWKANRDAANATMIDSDNVLLLRPVPVPSADVPHGSSPRHSDLSRGTTTSTSGLLSGSTPDLPAGSTPDLLSGSTSAFSPEPTPDLPSGSAPVLSPESGPGPTLQSSSGSSFDPFSSTVRPPVGATVLPESLYVAMIYHVDDGFAEFFAQEAVPVLREAGVPPVACFETEAAENTFPALPVRTGEQVFVWFARFDRPSDEREVALPGLESRLTSPPQRLRLAPAARSALR
ncbi:NIPSNAP family protein [Nonomuraea sp. CA-143628]|uniref:NIPSNAP family protein n=1 Tax=Nonomuraea sp. CA-143628 TaxID=3239997 RepID=UPI003D9006AD